MWKMKITTLHMKRTIKITKARTTATTTSIELITKSLEQLMIFLRVK